MEDWQKKYIVSKMPELLELTNCDPLFLSLLVQSGVFCSADIKNLASLADEHKKVYELYDRAQTRTGAYQKLINALSKVGQSGAANILQQGYATQL